MSLVGYDNILSKFNNYVLKEAGKGLSSNDYTPTDKNKVGLITITGTGNSFLADDGSYKTIVIPENDGIKDVQSGGSSVVNALGVAELHKVASTGNYNDLTNIPTTLVKDANYVHTDNNFTKMYKDLIGNIDVMGDGSKFLANDGTYYELTDVAKTGSYNDLTDVPNNIVTDANYVHTDNNFTTTLKTKLENMNSDGEANRINSISLNNNPLTIDSSKNVNIDLTAYALAANIPTKTSQLTNDSNFASDANYVHTDNNFTTTLKTKLNGIASGAQVNKIEIVKVDGNPLTINSADKSVNIVLSGFADTETVNDLANRVSNNEINIRSLQMSGLWRGIFATKAALPTNAKTGSSKFIGGTVYVNDYVIIKEDETHLDASGKPCKTRYYATAIADDGTITWTYFDKEEGSIATATNTSLGLVKGTTYNSTDETTIGKISVATDGTMSVNGIDDLGYLPLTGNSAVEKVMTGPIWFKSDIGGIYGTMGASDHYRIVGASTGEDAGYLEIATADNGTEPIYVRQYANSGTSFDSSKIARTLTLLDGSGNTTLPGNLNFTGTPSNITWTEGTLHQRISVPDKTDNNSVFEFQYEPSLGAGFSTIAKMEKDGRLIATGNLKTNAGTLEFKDKVTQQYNSNEQCIEFIFN